MDVTYLQKLPQAEREDLLKADALTVEETKYTRPLTPEEVAFYKDQLAENSILAAMLREEIKEFKKEKLKPVEEKISEAIEAVKFGAAKCEGELYKIADFDEEMIYILDKYANVINSRRMLPSERQFKIQALKNNYAS